MLWMKYFSSHVMAEDLLECDIDNRVKKILTYHSLNSFEKILCTTDIELLKYGLMPSTIKELKSTASESILPPFKTAYHLKSEENEKLPSGIESLDDYLKGGFKKGNLIDITGPPGVGKTQFCFALCVSSYIRAKENNILYFDVSCSFCSQRLLQIACEKDPLMFNDKAVLKDLCEKIIIYHPYSLKEILEWFKNNSLMLKERKVALVIIDSITPLVRIEGDSEVYSDLISLAQILKKLAEKFKFIVIITNQITTSFQSSQDVSSMAVDNNLSSINVVSALGPTWCHNILMRIILQFTGENTQQFLIAKSSNLPFTGFNFHLSKEGLTFSGHYFLYEGTNPSNQKIRIQPPLVQDLEI